MMTRRAGVFIATGALVAAGAGVAAYESVSQTPKPTAIAAAHQMRMVTFIESGQNILMHVASAPIDYANLHAFTPLGTHAKVMLAPGQYEIIPVVTTPAQVQVIQNNTAYYKFSKGAVGVESSSLANEIFNIMPSAPKDITIEVTWKPNPTVTTVPSGTEVAATFREVARNSSNSPSDEARTMQRA
jgi:hypothetical protein